MLTPDQIRQFLIRELGAVDAEVEPEALLFSSGAIDSFSLVSLVAFVEKHCDFQVGADEMTLDNWDSIARILKFIEHRKTAIHE